MIKVTCLPSALFLQCGYSLCNRKTPTKTARLWVEEKGQHPLLLYCPVLLKLSTANPQHFVLPELRTCVKYINISGFSMNIFIYLSACERGTPGSDKSILCMITRPQLCFSIPAKLAAA